MRRTLRTTCMLALVLALLLSGWALAGESVLQADLSSLKESGVLFEGVAPGCTMTELQQAGVGSLKKDLDTMYLDEETGGWTSAIYRQSVPGTPQIMLGELAMQNAEFHVLTGMSSSMVMDIALIPAEGTTVAQVEAAIAAVLGPAQQGAWSFEAGGHRIQVSLQAQGEACTLIRVDYLNLIEGTIIPVDLQQLKEQGLMLAGAVMGASEAEAAAGGLVLQSGEATESTISDTDLINRVVPLRMDQKVQLGDLQTKETRVQFWGDKLMNVSLNMEASATMEQVLAILEPVLGEKSEYVTSDGRLLGYQWYYQAGGHDLRLLASLYTQDDTQYCIAVDLSSQTLIEEVKNLKK